MERKANVFFKKASSAIPDSSPLFDSCVSQINRIEKLLDLKDRLRRAIKAEDYEFAAELRDNIHTMEEDKWLFKTMNN